MQIDFSLAPESSRRRTLVRALEALEAGRDDGEPPVVVEVGTCRSAHPLGSTIDGWSTRLFAWYARRVDGVVHSIDVSSEALAASAEVCGEYRDLISYHEGPGRAVLPRFDRIDLLYLDAGNDPSQYVEMWDALACSPRLVLFDDVHDCETFAGKGQMLIPLLLRGEYSLRFCGHFQALVERSP